MEEITTGIIIPPQKSRSLYQEKKKSTKISPNIFSRCSDVMIENVFSLFNREIPFIEELTSETNNVLGFIFHFCFAFWLRNNPSIQRKHIFGETARCFAKIEADLAGQAFEYLNTDLRIFVEYVLEIVTGEDKQ